MTWAHNFNRGAEINRPQIPMTLDALRAAAPSAFATRPHESRSTRYAYIPTSDVITGMYNAGFVPFKASQSISRVDGKGDFTKHMIRFRQQGATIQKVGDVVPEVVLINSHDGTSAYKLTAGMFRLVCSNGLIVADCTFGSISIPHVGNIVERVIEGSHEIIEGSARALRSAERWSNLMLTDGERGAFADAAREVRFGVVSEDGDVEVKTPITAAQLLEPRRYGDDRKDLWTTFNTIQENVVRGGLTGYGRDARNRTRRVTTRAVKGIDQDVKLNKALWTLASRMAALKGGSAVAA